MNTEFSYNYETLQRVEKNVVKKKPLFLATEYFRTLEDEKNLEKSYKKFETFSADITNVFIPTLQEEIGSLDDYFKNAFEMKKAPEEFIEGLKNTGYDVFCLLYALNNQSAHQKIPAITQRIIDNFSVPIGESTLKSTIRALLQTAETDDIQKKKAKLPHIENISTWSLIIFFESLKKDVDQIDNYCEKLEEIGSQGGIEPIFLERIYNNRLTRQNFDPFLTHANQELIQKIDTFFKSETIQPNFSSFLKFSLLIETVIKQNI